MNNTPNNRFPTGVVHVCAQVMQEASGLSYSVPALAESLASAGLPTTLVSCDPQAPYPSRAFQHITTPAIRFPPSIWYAPSLNSILDRLASSDALLHVHSLWTYPVFATGLAARSHLRPLVISPRGTLSPAALAMSSAKKRIMSVLWQDRLLRTATALHATSTAEAAEFRALNLQNPIIILPNGVMPKTEFASTANRSRRPELIFLSRFDPKKGIELLLDVWREIEKDAELSECTLRIIGQGPEVYTSSLKRIIEVNGLRRARIEGPLFGNDKFEAFASARSVILPTKNENFGNCIAEALSVGTPAICTDGAPWEGLNERQCGWWVPRTVNALKQAVVTALRLPDNEINAFGARGVEWMCEEFDWARIAGDLMLAYEWLSSGCRGSTAPACVQRY